MFEHLHTARAKAPGRRYNTSPVISDIVENTAKVTLGRRWTLKLECRRLGGERIVATIPHGDRGVRCFTKLSLIDVLGC